MKNVQGEVLEISHLLNENSNSFSLFFHRHIFMPCQGLTSQKAMQPGRIPTFSDLCPPSFLFLFFGWQEDFGWNHPRKYAYFLPSFTFFSFLSWLLFWSEKRWSTYTVVKMVSIILISFHSFWNKIT